jgi:hypothetical protein
VKRVEAPRSGGVSEDRISRACSARKHAFADDLVGEARLEELPHDPEREVALELAAAREQDEQTSLEPARAYLGDESRLSDAGGTFDDHDAGRAGESTRNRVIEHIQLAIALE